MLGLLMKKLYFYFFNILQNIINIKRRISILFDLIASSEDFAELKKNIYKFKVGKERAFWTEILGGEEAFLPS